MDDIYSKVRVLGTLRAGCAHRVWALLWSQTEKDAFENIRSVFEGRMGVDLMGTYLGIDLPADPIVKHPIEVDALVGSLLDSCSPPDPLADAMKKRTARRRSSPSCWHRGSLVPIFLREHLVSWD